MLRVFLDQKVSDVWSMVLGVGGGQDKAGGGGRAHGIARSCGIPSRGQVLVCMEKQMREESKQELKLNPCVAGLY